MAEYIVALNPDSFASSTEARNEITGAGATISEIYALTYTYKIEATAEQLANISNISHQSLSSSEVAVESQAIDYSHFRTLDNRLDNAIETGLYGDVNFRPKYKGDGVTVYIVDTGVDGNHIELANSNVQLLSTQYSDGGIDTAGHGTAVASLIVGENIGIAKNAGLYNVKAFQNNSGNVQIGHIIGALSSVKGHHDTNDQDDVKVVCLPWTTPQNNFIDAKVRELNSGNLVVVAAAGNHNANVSSYSPSGVAEIITVGSVNRNGNVCGFTNMPFGPSGVSNPGPNYGSPLDIFALGEDVNYAEVLSPDDDYLSADGTSLTAGIVAGGVASYIQKHQNKNSNEIKDIVIAEGSTLGKQYIGVEPGSNSNVDLNAINLSLLTLDAEDSSDLFTVPSSRIMNIQVNNIANVDLGLNNTAANVEVLTFSPLSPWMSFNVGTGVFEANTNSLPANVSPGIYMFAVRGEVGGNVLVEEYSVGVYTSAESELDSASSYYYDTDTSSYDPVETTTYEGAVPQKP